MNKNSAIHEITLLIEDILQEVTLICSNVEDRYKIINAVMKLKKDYIAKIDWYDVPGAL